MMSFSQNIRDNTNSLCVQLTLGKRCQFFCIIFSNITLRSDAIPDAVAWCLGNVAKCGILLCSVGLCDGFVEDVVKSTEKH